MPNELKPKKPLRTNAPRQGSITEYLSADARYARIAEQANRLRLLQTLLDSALPTSLTPGTHVANIRQGKLRIHTNSGAVAAKLRQLAPRLVNILAQQSQEVTGIDVRVQARPTQGTTKPSSRPKIIGPRPKLALESLASGLASDSPVRRAVEKLLSNIR